MNWNYILTPSLQRNSAENYVSFMSYQFWWSRKRVRFTRSSLSITECCTAEAFDCHLNNSLNARIFYNIGLGCTRLKNYIISEEFWLLTTTRPTRYSFTLHNDNINMTYIIDVAIEFNVKIKARVSFLYLPVFARFLGMTLD